jgi:hypothetical protein
MDIDELLTATRSARKSLTDALFDPFTFARDETDVSYQHPLTVRAEPSS